MMSGPVLLWTSCTCVVLSLSLWACFASGQIVVQPDTCEERMFCRQCISLSGCVWCKDPDLVGPHCIPREASMGNCNESHIEDPHGRVVSTTPEQISSGELISPSVVALELRVGEPQSFVVAVTPQANYPLDLYILMDLSSSMTDELMGIQALTNELSNTLEDITPDYRIGFGAFNEKPLLPFTTPDFSIFGLTSTDYSFRHILSLTNDTAKFQEAVNNVGTVFNNDGPEALLEALLQVTVCTEVIGWRESARKLVLVLTDQGFHIAGEGVLAGAFIPNDGNCYVPMQDSLGAPVDYPMWGRLDYPSIGLVDAKLREFDIIPIFSSVQQFEETYTTLVNFIEGSVFELLERDLTLNVTARGQIFLDIIRRSYVTTSRKVELIPNATMGLQYGFNDIQCEGANILNDRTCDEVQVGQTVNFTVSMTLTQCSEELTNRTTSIRIPGLGRVSVQVTEICSCSCEDQVQYNHTRCNGGGHLSCGVCECIPGRFGDHCQCDSEEAVTRLCPAGPVNVTMETCSSRGTCECGVCICDDPRPELVPNSILESMYFGPACECDNFNCPRNSTGAVCSGRGKCGCGRRCTCEVSPVSGDLFTGAACQCPPVSEVCLNPDSNNLTCSDHGNCVCDHCVCEEGFGGSYCSMPIVPLVIECNAQSCVECQKMIAPDNVDCPSLNCSVELVEPVTDELYQIEGTNARECIFTDSRNCIHYYFTIGVGAIHAENTELCSETILLIPIWSIVLITVVGLVIIGILILILVKVIVVQMDKREVRKWENDRGDINFQGTSENPLYTSCNQKIDNVVYNPEGTNDNPMLLKFHSPEDEVFENKSATTYRQT